MGSIASNLLLFIILAAKVFVAYTPQLFVLLPAHWVQVDILKQPDGQFASRLCLLNALIGLMWVCYLRCARVNPGRVCRGWINLKSSGAEQASAGSVEVSSNSRRYCTTCNVFKPPRSHHCKSCRQCVLRMDHHCPWTNNCVGYDNQADFLRYLVYMNLSLAYLNYLLWPYISTLITDWYYSTNELLLPSSCKTMLVIDMLAIFIVCFLSALLTGWQFWCAVQNMTSIESWEKKRIESLVEQRLLPADVRHLFFESYPLLIAFQIVFPYDIGFVKNLQSILGNNVLFWFLPMMPPPGDGHQFELSELADSSSDWPPISRDALTNERHDGHARDLDGARSHQDEHPVDEEDSDSDSVLGLFGKWKSEEDESLQDFGVDLSNETMRDPHTINVRETN